MCSVKKWEFNCPQFVDFEAGLETSTTDVWLENEEDHHKAIATLNQPFRSRMATPKVKLNTQLKNSPFVKVSNLVLKTDDEKIASISKLPRRFSKSDSCLNRPVENWMTPKVKHSNKAPKCNRRRLSENNIKKKVYPVTPMCLKRTQKKTKGKGKTSEEIEMDKITELQNKLKQQLRLNEVNLKRMKRNKAPYPAQKVLTRKNKAKATVEDRGENQPLHLNGLKNRITKPRCNNFEKVPKENSKENRSEAIKTKSQKLQSVLDSVFKKSDVASNVLRDVNGNSKGQYRKKYGEHCGINFFPNQVKTIPQPFSFDTSSVSSQNSSFYIKDIKADSFALKTPNTIAGKENIFRVISHRKEKK